MAQQSSLVMRFVNNDFQENKEPTIGGMLSLLFMPAARAIVLMMEQPPSSPKNAPSQPEP
jgi:hypothetical protein